VREYDNSGTQTRRVARLARRFKGRLNLPALLSADRLMLWPEFYRMTNELLKSFHWQRSAEEIALVVVAAKTG
jgi:hypothetical protein